MNRLPAILAFGLAACASIEVEVFREDDVDLLELEGFSWRLPLEADRRAPLAYNQVVAAVEAELEKRGYSRDEASPDILLDAHVTRVGKSRLVELSGFNPYLTPRGACGPPSWAFRLPEPFSTSVAEYERGTIVVEILDASTRQRIWHGMARTDMARDESPREVSATVREAVKRLLYRFP